MHYAMEAIGYLVFCMHILAAYEKSSLIFAPAYHWFRSWIFNLDQVDGRTHHFPEVLKIIQPAVQGTAPSDQVVCVVCPRLQQWLHHSEAEVRSYKNVNSLLLLQYADLV